MQQRVWVPLFVGLLLQSGCSKTAQIQEFANFDNSIDRMVMECSGELLDGVRVVNLQAFMFDWAPNPIVLKAGETVQLVVSSEDTTHGLVIPELGINKKLLPGHTIEIEFTAPSPGIYDFFCSVVCGWGHNSMTGYLLVLGENELARAGVEYDLLDTEMRPFQERKLIKNYRFEDLQQQMDWSSGSRSYTTGKKLFIEMTCSKCHRIDGPGDRVGPNLARADLKLSRRELLREVVEPSRKIEDKYRPWVFLTGGKATIGMLLEENSQYYLVDQTPEEAIPPMKILKGELDETPQISAQSLMPSGLLNSMTIEEIRDLLAYVHAKGDPHHAYFEFKDSPERPTDAEIGRPDRGRGR